MKKITLFEVSKKGSLAEVFPIDGGCLYDVSQIPSRFGLKFPDSSFVCVDGDSLSDMIHRVAFIAKHGCFSACRCNRDDFDNSPSVEICDVSISVSVQTDINAIDGDSQTFILTAKYSAPDDSGRVMVEVVVSREKFVVRA